MRGRFGPTRRTRRQRVQRLRRPKPPPVYRFMAMIDCGHLYIAHGPGSGMTAML
jgi:hypothetical protein